MRRLDSLFWYGPLDLEKMRRGAEYLEGTHDFRGFASSHLSAENTERTIYETKLWKEEDMIHFRITGNGFLYNMVRIIVGDSHGDRKGGLPLRSGFWKYWKKKTGAWREPRPGPAA